MLISMFLEVFLELGAVFIWEEVSHFDVFESINHALLRREIHAQLLLGFLFFGALRWVKQGQRKVRPGLLDLILTSG